MYFDDQNHCLENPWLFHDFCHFLTNSMTIPGMENKKSLFMTFPGRGNPAEWVFEKKKMLVFEVAILCVLVKAGWWWWWCVLVGLFMRFVWRSLGVEMGVLGGVGVGVCLGIWVDRWVSFEQVTDMLILTLSMCTMCLTQFGQKVDWQSFNLKALNY